MDEATDPARSCAGPAAERSGLGSLLLSDLRARHPNARRWKRLRVVVTFLRDPAMRAVLVFRIVSTSPGRGVLWWRTPLIWLWRSEIYRCEVGESLQIDGLHGTIIAHGVVMGVGVHLQRGVSIGTARAPEPGTMLRCPVLGDRVTVESGAVIGGPITVGDGARIGRGSVISRDVPPGAHVLPGSYR